METTDKFSVEDLLKLSEELRAGRETLQLQPFNASNTSANEAPAQEEIYYTPISPCPFCGSEYVDCERYDIAHPAILSRSAKYQYTCHCKKCNAMGPYKDTSEAAIEWWNGPREENDRRLAEIKRLKASVAYVMALFTPSESEEERDDSL